MTEDKAHWITSGQGRPPRQSWSFTADASLNCVEAARETGEILVADSSGGIYLLNRLGKVLSLMRGPHRIRALAWSDTGSTGAALTGENQLFRFNRQFEVQWLVELSEPILALATDPYGKYIAVSLADGLNFVFDSRKQQVSHFETVRPLSFLRFLTTRPLIMGAAEYGLLCCHQLDGKELWNQKVWSNVGDLGITGDGNSVMLAGFNHGIQFFDSDGDEKKSYVMEGTVNHIASSFQAEKVVASTLEKHLYRLDAQGDIIWATHVPDDVNRLLCDPFGEWFICALKSGRLIQLDWSILDEHY